MHVCIYLVNVLYIYIYKVQCKKKFLFIFVFTQMILCYFVFLQINAFIATTVITNNGFYFLSFVFCIPPPPFRPSYFIEFV